MSKLDGKVALVSGSGRGIGRAIALKLASEGARVVVNDLDKEPAEETVAAIKAMGSDAAACVGNVSAPDFGDRFVGTAVEKFGTADIVVNNAGFTWDAVVQKMTDEQWQAIMDTHVTAPFRILRSFAEVLRANAKKEAEEGKEVFRKVVNISSIAGLYGNAGQINYSSAKAALVGMTRTMAKEWGRYKCNVNCVAFGYVKTRMTQELQKDGSATVTIEDKELPVGIQPQMIKMMEAMIPLGRGATPEEAADAVYLFCSPESNYISGQVVLAGGGLIV